MEPYSRIFLSIGIMSIAFSIPPRLRISSQPQTMASSRLVFHVCYQTYLSLPSVLHNFTLCDADQDMRDVPIVLWVQCVCPHGAVIKLLQPASTQYGVGPVCVPMELLSTYFNLPQPSMVLVQCVSPWSCYQPTSTCLNPVWCWSSVCTHRATVNLFQPASTQCGVGPVCVPIELLSTK